MSAMSLPRSGRPVTQDTGTADISRASRHLHQKSASDARRADSAGGAGTTRNCRSLALTGRHGRLTVFPRSDSGRATLERGDKARQLRLEEMMQRREFIATVATAAAMAAGAPLAAARTPAAPAVGAGPAVRLAKYAALEAAAGACLDAGEDCLRHCFAALASEDMRMAACAATVYELIATCRAVRTLAAAESAHVPLLAKAVEQACIACTTECEKFPRIAECVACGEACLKCAEECRMTA
jgi:Cys-rich four helix bundle protein (predicted Tat secretion target)